MSRWNRNLPWLAVVALGLVIGACDNGADDDADLDVDGEEVVAEPDATDTPAATNASGALVNPNTAQQSRLATLPGMTPELAAALVEGRPHQDMRVVDQLLSASLDEAQREALYREMWIPIDLNNASEEEILLIPGVGSRMAHEFEEYRPYEAMAQFRREIGKYVDDEEVARLERYVSIRQ